MGLFNYLKDEEALFALGLLTEGSKGKTIGDAAFPSLITAGKTSAMFQKNDAAKFKSESLQKLLKSDQVSDLDKLYISAGISAPKDNIIPFLSKLLATCKLFTKENFNDEFGKLNKAEQSIYKNKIEGNVEVLQAYIADKLQDQVTLQPDQLIAVSGYKLTDKAGGTYESVAELVQGQMEANPEATFEQAFQSLITAGLIEE